MLHRALRALRRLLLAVLAVTVGVPLGLVLLYRVVPPPATPLMVLRLFEGEGWSRDWTALTEISAHLPRAVIAAEDNLFCRHNGFDWGSLQAAVEAYAAGEQAGGGSTVTMQTAKNLFLWPQRSLLRKALEVPPTLMLEVLWPKRRILEVYLNVAEWGPGIYGAEAASRHYFGKPAANLSARESTLLAAVLPNPREWSPAPAGPYVAQRARVIERRVGQLGPLLDCAPS